MKESAALLTFSKFSNFVFVPQALKLQFQPFFTTDLHYKTFDSDASVVSAILTFAIAQFKTLLSFPFAISDSES